MKKIILLLVLLNSIFVDAQDFAKLQAAFSQSYIFENEKNYSEAIESISKVHSEKMYETNMRLGWLNSQAKKYPESVNYYKAASTLNPNSIESKLGLASAYYAQSLWEPLINLYNDILKIDPNNITANYRLGLIYYNRENFTQAQKYFDKYLTLFPFDFDALSINALNNYKLGKKELAKEQFNKALLLYPKNGDSLEGLRLCR